MDSDAGLGVRASWWEGVGGMNQPELATVERLECATVARSVFPDRWGPAPVDERMRESWIRSWAGKEQRARQIRELMLRRLQLLDAMIGPE
jgi:hypothetical protein